MGRTRVSSHLEQDQGQAIRMRTASGLERALLALGEEDADVILLSLSAPTGIEDPRKAVEVLVQATGGAPVLVLAEESAPALEAELRATGAGEVLSLARGADVMGELLVRGLRWVVERAHLLASLERVSEQRLHAAYHDPLTDLPNRSFFHQHLRTLLAQARRSTRSIAILFLDLDRFKPINDTFGHTTGDLLLQSVARRIENSIRKGDVAARKGGDEFTIILDGIHRPQNAAKVARKILDEIAKPFVIDGHRVAVTASIGIAIYPADGDEVDSLVKHADIAMYRAKDRGGNSYQFFQAGMNESALERLELEQSLRLALEREEFVLHYQPQFEVATGRVCGTEALVRWQHPDLGMIGPDQFIPVAEETGLIDLLGDWVLNTACAQNRTWQERGLPAIPVAVNWSARQFNEKSLLEKVGRALRRSGLDAAYLDLELTESTVMQDVDAASDVLHHLRELGVSVSIDDFGTGHSSLGYLKRFPISRLKIDKTFISTLLEDPRDAAITEAIIAMAHRLDMKAVAEGVETAGQLEFLRQPGCDEVQGYFLSRPLPPEQVEGILATGGLQTLNN